MDTIVASSTLPAHGLETARRANIISQMNVCLADLVALGASAKQAHWNLRGPNFQGLHGLFDIVADEARAHADLIAERIVTLGGTAHATIDDVAHTSDLRTFPTDERRWEILARALHDQVLFAAEHLRSLAKDLDDELVSQDLVIEVIRGLEMRAWMIDAHIPA